MAIDVTEEILKRRKIEEQRDTDMLTGLYNRQGMTIRLAQLFRNPESLCYGALVMADADGLKRINDAYGHEKGDMYLKGIAEALENLGQKSSIAARLGGDEFVLFLYGYEKKELTHILKRLEEIQRQKEVSLGGNLRVPLRFSFGYSLIRGERDYEKLLKEADEKMYVNKRERRNSERMKLA